MCPLGRQADRGQVLSEEWPEGRGRPWGRLTWGSACLQSRHSPPTEKAAGPGAPGGGQCQTTETLCGWAWGLCTSLREKGQALGATGPAGAPKPALGTHFSKLTGCSIHNIIHNSDSHREPVPWGPAEGNAYAIAALVCAAAQEVGATAPILQLTEQKLREGKWPAWGHRAVPSQHARSTVQTLSGAGGWASRWEARFHLKGSFGQRVSLLGAGHLASLQRSP